MNGSSTHETRRSPAATLGYASVVALSLGCNALLGTDGGEKRRTTDVDDTERSTDPSDPSAPASGDTPGENDGGHDPQASSDASTTNGPTGPGALGALPSGYCCTVDDQCRSRHCEGAGSGGKMCLDSCTSDDACSSKEVTFECDAVSRFKPGWCRPPSLSLACIPQAQFIRGTKATGDCCMPTFDGRNGNECAGGQCGAFNGGPYVCNQWCKRSADCPAGWYCTDNMCIPDPIPSVCK